MTTRQIAQRSGQPGSWIPGDVLPNVQTPRYIAPMFEIKPDHLGELEDHERELGCECEEFGDGEWTDASEAMRWYPDPLERMRAALDLPEED